MVRDIRYRVAPILFVTRKFAVSWNEIRRYVRTWSRALRPENIFFRDSSAGTTNGGGGKKKSARPVIINRKMISNGVTGRQPRHKSLNLAIKQIRPPAKTNIHDFWYTGMNPEYITRVCRSMRLGNVRSDFDVNRRSIAPQFAHCNLNDNEMFKQTFDGDISPLARAAVIFPVRCRALSIYVYVLSILENKRKKLFASFLLPQWLNNSIQQRLLFDFVKRIILFLSKLLFMRIMREMFIGGKIISPSCGRKAQIGEVLSKRMVSNFYGHWIFIRILFYGKMCLVFETV